jgi:V/A-type H+/Na+-transporting ATPase subunit I
MFYPQIMVEMELIVPAKDLLPVTKELAGRGIFQQVDASYLSSPGVPDVEGSWQEKATAYAGLERRILNAMQILNVEEGLPDQADRNPMIDVEMTYPVLEPIEQEVLRVSEQIAYERKILEQNESYLQQLEPVAGINFDVSTLRQPHHIFTMLGVIPAENIERLQTSLERIPCVFLVLHKDNQKAVAYLAGGQNNADILERAARSAYFNPLDLPELQPGTPSEIITSLRTSIERSNQSIADQKKAIDQLRSTHQQSLRALLWRVRTSHMLAMAIARFGQLRYTYVIVGWVPASSIESLTQRLKAVSKDLLIDTNLSKRSGARHDVPVSLTNPGFLGAFQRLVTIFSQPSYKELDPTILIALTFPLLFGAMFGDVGHGLLLTSLGGLLVSKKVRALRGLASLGGLIVACGLMATLFGFLYGSIFGLETVLPALWIRPMENITLILTITIGAGIVLLSLGFFFGILNAWTARDWGRLLFGHNGLAGLLLYWSLVGLLLTLLVKKIDLPVWVFAIPAILSGLAVLFSDILKNLVYKRRPLIEGGVGTYAIQVFFEMFETLLGLLSNSLSYVRVGAFAVAHVGLSGVIFILAGMASPARGVGYWIVLAIGTLFIVGFEGLIVGIQTMRLEYYEFFGKFYTGGGTQFMPLSITSVPDSNE